MLKYLLIFTLLSVSSCVKKNQNGRLQAEKSLKCETFSKCSVWDLNYLQRNKQLSSLLELFNKNKYASAAKNINIEGKTRSEIEKQLLDFGFKKHVFTKENEINDSGIIYSHKDGSVIRLKNFDQTRKFRKQSYAVKYAAYDVTMPLTWENEAFKISEAKIALPKSPKSEDGLKLLPKNYDSAWMDRIMDEVHIDIKN